MFNVQSEQFGGKIHPNSKDPLHPPISPSLRRRIFEQTLVTTGCSVYRHRHSCEFHLWNWITNQRAGDKPNVFTRSWRRVKKQYATKGWEFHSWGTMIAYSEPMVQPLFIIYCTIFPRNKRCLVPPKHPITGAVTSHNPQRPCPVAQISCPGLKVARCWWPWRMLQMEIVKAFKHKSILNK